MNDRPSSSQANSVVEGYEELLANRLEEFYFPVKEAFSKLFEFEPPVEVQSYHIEVFLDDPGFSFTVFSMDNKNCQIKESDVLKKFNERISNLWPIITAEELEAYTIWEDDPKWGRQEALEQPIDNMDITKIVLPWFAEIVKVTRGKFTKKVTVGVHDTFQEQEI